MAADETKVGIRELKAHLSHYVRLAREGARVVVTDRGEEVAELRAVTPAHPGLRELIDSGMVTWSGGRPSRSRRPATLHGEPMSETIDCASASDPLP